MNPLASFPQARPRRLRQTAAVRGLVQETFLRPQQLIAPLFVRHGVRIRKPISSMPGQTQLSVDELVAEVQALQAVGVSAVLLFGVPDVKDDLGSENLDPNGIIPQAIGAVKRAVPAMIVISDMCFCEYTSHGHCGIVNTEGATSYDPGLPLGYVLNDATLEQLGKASVVHARAGADFIAPSGMMDGMVGAIRAALDSEGFGHTAIMSYAAKFASALYGPFRDAAEGAPKFGDRSQYQMEIGNVREAMQEAAHDESEGADVLIIKPAVTNLDVIQRIRAAMRLPLAAYQVSGEYSMIKAASRNGWLDEQKVVLETLTSIRRAGADMIITYFARDAAGWLR